MRQTTAQALAHEGAHYGSWNGHVSFSAADFISADWPVLRAQLLSQWKKITARELDDAGPHRYRIANLIERKYGISAQLVENYLCNFERTMPLADDA